MVGFHLNSIRFLHPIEALEPKQCPVCPAYCLSAMARVPKLYFEISSTVPFIIAHLGGKWFQLQQWDSEHVISTLSKMLALKIVIAKYKDLHLDMYGSVEIWKTKIYIL